MDVYDWAEEPTISRLEFQAAERPGIGRNLAALFSGQVITWTMTLAWTFVVPRLLGPAGMGLIVTAWSVTGILAIVLGLGTKNYLVREIVVDRARAPGLVATGVILRLVMSPVFLLATAVYAHFAHYGGEGDLVLYLAAGATILTLLAEPLQAAFQATERMKYLAYSDVINKSAQGLLGILLAIAGLGAAGFAACWMVMSGVVLVLDAVWLRPYVRVSLRTGVRRLIDMAKESVAYWAFGAFFMIYLWIDSAMLSLMTNPTVVGWYGVPTKLFQSMMFLPVLISTAWLPRLVREFERSPNRLQEAGRAPIELALALGIPLAAAIAAAAAPMIRLLYGPAYAGSIPVMVILALCIPFMYLNIMFGQIAIAAKRQVVWTWAMVGATVVNPAINAALIPLTQAHFHNGAIGAAVSLVLTEVLIVAFGFAVTGRRVLGRSGLRRLVLTSIAAGAMWGVAYLLRDQGAAGALLAGGLTFIVLAAVLRLVTPAEVAFLRQKFQRGPALNRYSR
jgi:O-antigen/teichoic acid export membrane protein